MKIYRMLKYERERERERERESNFRSTSLRFVSIKYFILNAVSEWRFFDV